jgi:hypothetical protein
MGEQTTANQERELREIADPDDARTGAASLLLSEDHERGDQPPVDRPLKTNVFFE